MLSIRSGRSGCGVSGGVFVGGAAGSVAGKVGVGSFVFAFCDAEFEFAGDNSVAGGFL